MLILQIEVANHLCKMEMLLVIIPALTSGLFFMMLMVLVVAVAMKIVGVLLITALLIIPAASARRYAKSPEGMVLIAMVMGVFAVVLGLLASMYWDTPAGPSIVSASVLLFFVTRVSVRH